MVEGLKYDFTINGYKVQEKVAGVRKDRSNSYWISFYCNNSKIEKKRQYKSYAKGDNSFYWIWLEDNPKEFYLFPEEVLIERNIVDRKTGPKPVLGINNTNWTKEYLYSFNDKNKLIDLFTK